MDDEHSPGMRSMTSTPVADDELPPQNMAPLTTRSTRRLSTHSEDLEPAKKKPKHTKSGSEDYRVELEKIQETQSSMLKLIKDLDGKLDCVKSLIATKMADLETKISTVNNDRVGALQTTRQDGFLATQAPHSSTARWGGAFGYAHNYSWKERYRGGRF